VIMRNYQNNIQGSVSVEASLLLMIMVALTGATIEAGYAYFQWNGAQQAARHGARLAATSEPVSRSLETMTGMERGVQIGDPIPDYTLNCAGKTRRCNNGSFNSLAMNKIVFGLDNDNTCAKTQKERRGMCDVFNDITLENVEVTYASSGLGTAGYPANPAPLVTVKVTNMKF